MTQISKEQVSEMALKLRESHPNWATLVAEGISKEKDWKEWTKKDCSRSNVNNIAAGRLEGQLHRRLFIKVGTQILMKTQKSVKELTESAAEVINANN